MEQSRSTRCSNNAINNSTQRTQRYSAEDGETNQDTAVARLEKWQVILFFQT